MAVDMAVAPRLAAGTVLAGMLVAVLAFVDAARAAFPGQNGKLAFQECPFRCGITTIDETGTTQVTVGGVFGPPGTQVIQNDSLPRWSADGQWIAFQRNLRPATSPFSTNTLSVMRHDGTQLRSVYELPDGAVTSLTWSPDGEQIAFTRTGAVGIWIVDAEGPPDLHVLYPTSQAAFDANPSTYIFAREVEWSPAGDMIAFSYAKGETTKGIGLLPPDADSHLDLVPVTTLPWAKPGGGCCNRSEHGEPTWSPNGARIAFNHSELDATINEGTSRPETIDPDGTDLAPVIDFPQGDSGAAAFVTEPAWSPDGQWLVWKLVEGTTAKWEGAHPDGSARGDLPVIGGQVDWQPCSAGCQSLHPGWEPPDPPSVAIDDVTIAEGNAGTASATFTLTRSGEPFVMDQPSEVFYGVEAGTAMLGTDVISEGGSVDFASGETAKQVTIDVVGDVLDEIDEAFAVDLFAGTNAAIVGGDGIGTIADDDPAPSVSLDDANVIEGGTATLTATLSAVSGRTVTVAYGTTPGTAAAGEDFLGASGTLTFAPGETSRTLSVGTLDDFGVEGAESLAVTLSQPAGATIADGEGTVTIADNDTTTAPPPPPPPPPPAGGTGGAGGAGGAGGGGGGGGAAPFTAKSAIALPPATGCVRRSLRLRVREPEGVDVTRILVFVGNRKPLVRKGDDAVGSTTLRRLPKGRFRLRVQAQSRDGRFVQASRRYRRCR
jgi:hypothetical protein